MANVNETGGSPHHPNELAAAEEWGWWTRRVPTETGFRWTPCTKEESAAEFGEPFPDLNRLALDAVWIGNRYVKRDPPSGEYPA